MEAPDFDSQPNGLDVALVDPCLDTRRVLYKGLLKDYKKGTNRGINR